MIVVTKRYCAAYGNKKLFSLVDKDMYTIIVQILNIQVSIEMVLNSQECTFLKKLENLLERNRDENHTVLAFLGNNMMGKPTTVQVFLLVLLRLNITV